MASTTSIGNLSVSLQADTSQLDSGVEKAAQDVSKAFAAVDTTVSPSVAEGDKAGTGGVQEAILLMTRQSASIGTTLSAGLARVVPAMEQMVHLMRDVSIAAKRANQEAWRADLAQRTAAATDGWKKKLVDAESVVYKIASGWGRVTGIIGTATNLLSKSKGFATAGIEGGLSKVLSAPTRGVGGLAKGLGSAGKQAAGEALSESESGVGKLLGAFAAGGLVGGVVALITKTIDWAKANRAVASAFEALKGFVMPFIDKLSAAFAPVISTLAAFGQAAVDTFKNLFAGSAKEGEGAIGGMMKKVIDWVKETVDGGNIVNVVFRKVGEGIAFLSDSWGLLVAVFKTVVSWVQQFGAFALGQLAKVGQGLDWLSKKIFGTGIGIEEFLKGASEASAESAARLATEAGEAWNAPSARDGVKKFFDDVEKRAKELKNIIAAPGEDHTWDKFAESWNKALGKLADSAKGFWDQLLSPMDKLAEKFNDLDKMKKLGLLSEEDYTKLKSKAASEVLGQAATANPAALEANSREARTALLSWQASQKDPLKMLPDLARQQLEVANRQKEFLGRIADSVAENTFIPNTFALPN